MKKVIAAAMVAAGIALGACGESDWQSPRDRKYGRSAQVVAAQARMTAIAEGRVTAAAYDPSHEIELMQSSIEQAKFLLPAASADVGQAKFVDAAAKMRQAALKQAQMNGAMKRVATRTGNDIWDTTHQICTAAGESLLAAASAVERQNVSAVANHSQRYADGMAICAAGIRAALR